MYLYYNAIATTSVNEKPLEALMYGGKRYFSVQLVVIESFQLWWGLSTFHVEIFSDDEPKAS